MNLPKLREVLDEIEFFERERTDRQLNDLTILLYNFGVSFRKVARVLGRIGVEQSDVTVWNWVQKFGQRLREADRRPAADLPAVLLIDETAIKQRGHQFVLFAAVDPETRHLIHASVAPSRNYLTTWRLLTELAELYGRFPPIVVTDGATSTVPSVELRVENDRHELASTRSSTLGTLTAPSSPGWASHALSADIASETVLNAGSRS